MNLESESVIRLVGADVYAHHGAGDAEQEVGGRYSFDIEFRYDISNAALADDLDEAVDYVEVYRIARDVVVQTKRRLLEAIVLQIVDSILVEFPKIMEVSVRLRKLRVPINGLIDAVEVEYSRRRGA